MLRAQLVGTATLLVIIDYGMPQVTVTCHTASGQLALQSWQVDPAAQTTHLRGSITCSLGASRLVLTAAPATASGLAVVRQAPRWLVALSSTVMTTAAAEAGITLLSTPAGLQPPSDRVRGGCLASVATPTAQSGAGAGYRLHPAAADSAMHTGALNPAAPRDERTRVPAALGAYMAVGGGSGQAASAEAWACVDTGASLVDTSRVNTYRCSCCTTQVTCLSLAGCELSQ